MKVTYLIGFCLCMLTRYTTGQSSSTITQSTSSASTKAAPGGLASTKSTKKVPGPTNPTHNSKSSTAPTAPTKPTTSTTPTTPKPLECSLFNCEGHGCSKNASTTTCLVTEKTCQIISFNNGTFVNFNADCAQSCTAVTTGEKQTRCCNTNACNKESLFAAQSGAIDRTSCTFVLVMIQALTYMFC